MIETFSVLIGFPDHGRERDGKLFVWDGTDLSQITYEAVSLLQVPLVTVEFYAIASEMVAHGLKLPPVVIDLEELTVFTSSEPKIKAARKRFDSIQFLKRFGLTDADAANFKRLTSSSADFPEGLILNVARAASRAFKVVSRLASIRGEWTRFIEVEVPVLRVLFSHLMQGIEFDEGRLSEFRKSLEFDFFLALKNFSKKHNLPLTVPNNQDLEPILRAQGFDLENVSVEYLLEFISLKNDLGQDLQELRQIRITRDALNGISHKQSTSFPQVFPHGTRTSRTLLKTPSLQNIARKYRSVIVPKPNLQFSYVDYDQFEVGIMGALSKDPILLNLYAQDDLYNSVAAQLFDSDEKRKQAKRLFLSYAYGMKLNNLVRAAVEGGSDKAKAKATFKQFVAFEAWKAQLAKDLHSDRKIGTEMGNYYHIEGSGKPTAKELRSAVSQRVQGTGALIYKLAILEVAKLPDFRIVLPMHDAVLVEHAPTVDAHQLVTIFETVMTDFFDGEIAGKASISNFFE